MRGINRKIYQQLRSQINPLLLVATRGVTNARFELLLMAAAWKIYLMIVLIFYRVEKNPLKA